MIYNKAFWTTHHTKSIKGKEIDESHLAIYSNITRYTKMPFYKKYFIYSF